MFELVYTSVPQGLLPGTRGFSTVAFTSGMPPNLIMPLENLSGYNFIFQDGMLPPELNLPCCCYIKMRFGNQTLLVASRIAPNGLDYSQRNNKIAHHWLFESREEVEQTQSGAAGLLGCDEYFMHNFTGEPRELAFRRVPAADPAKLPAMHFQTLAGDSGWAGVIAQRFRSNPEQALYIKYPRHTDPARLLDLVSEVCALLDRNELADFTFSTYFTQQGSSTDCFLRMLPDFSPQLVTVERFHTKNLLVLDGRQILPAEYENSPLCHTARYGWAPDPVPPPAKEWDFPAGSSVSEDDIPRMPLPPLNIKKPAPALKNSHCVRQAAPVHAEKTHPVQTSMHKKLIFWVTGLLLLVTLISVLVLFTSSRDSNQPEQVKKVQDPAKNISEPVKKLPDPVSQSRSKSPTFSAPPPQPAQSAVKTVRKKPQQQPHSTISLADDKIRDQALQLDSAAGLHFFAGFELARASKQKQYIMPLPEKLHNPDEIYVEMRIPGQQAILPNNRDFIRPGKRGGITVIEAQKGIVPHIPISSGTDAPELRIEPTADGKNLKFITSGGQHPVIIPSMRNISKFYFRFQNNVLSADCQFHTAYLRHLQPGKINISTDGIFSYTPSPLEKTLRNYIVTRIGKSSVLTLCSQKLPVAKWNRSALSFGKTVKQYQQNCKDIDAMSKTQSLPLLSRELKKFTDSLDDNALYADMESLCKKVTDKLNSFFTPELLHPDTASEQELKKLISQVEKILSKSASETEKEQKKVKEQINKWNAQIKQIQKLRSLLKENLQNIKTLKNQEREIKSIYSKMINPVQSVSKDAEISFSAMLIDPEKNLPQQITPEKITRLVKILQQQLKILPLNAE